MKPSFVKPLSKKTSPDKGLFVASQKRKCNNSLSSISDSFLDVKYAEIDDVDHGGERMMAVYFKDRTTNNFANQTDIIDPHHVDKYENDSDCEWEDSQYRKGLSSLSNPLAKQFSNIKTKSTLIDAQTMSIKEEICDITSKIEVYENLSAVLCAEMVDRASLLKELENFSNRIFQEDYYTMKEDISHFFELSERVNLPHSIRTDLAKCIFIREFKIDCNQAIDSFTDIKNIDFKQIISASLSDVLGNSPNKLATLELLKDFILENHYSIAKAIYNDFESLTTL